MRTICHLAIFGIFFLAMTGCEEAREVFEGPKKKEVVINRGPSVTEIPTPPPPPKVDREKIAAIEHRDSALGIIRLFAGSLPTQRTDAMLEALADVPDELFTISDLDVSSSQVTDAGLPVIARMARVVSLDISHLTFTERSLVGLRELPNLKKLTMLKARFPGNPCLAAIGQIETLEELTLSETPVNDADLAGLRGMPNLRVLHLDFTPLTDAVFEHIATLPNLEVLTISQTNITSRGLQKLVSGPAGNSIRILDIHKTFAGNNGFGQLDGLRGLEELDASTAQVTDKSLAGWTSPPKLRVLNLSENTFTNNSLPAILKSPKLEELILKKVSGINDPGLNHIVKKTTLTFIQLDQTGVTLQSAQLLKQKMPSTKVGIAGTIY